MSAPANASFDIEQSAATDAELVRAAQAGDSRSLECLIERHYAWLVSLLTHMARDPELASDIAQEAMLTASQRLGALRDHDAFRTWLYRVAASQLNSAYRGQPTRRAVSLDELLDRFPWRRELATLEVHIKRYGDREEAKDALDGLSAEDRELLLLRFVAGFTGAEVAQIAGISPAAARKRISRAVHRYQRCHATRQPAPRLALKHERMM
ncbi:MAG TPA: RNA polymerase sigma factor [Thermomicrobiales bacterium]|nr:RNA polymerase sigma factor [Thermomicrobiales bacterium]